MTGDEWPIPEWMQKVRDEFEARDQRNASLSIEEMLELPPEEAVEALAHRAIDLRFAEDDTEWRAALPGLVVVYDGWCIQSEVENGGLSQWHFNHTRDEATGSNASEVAASLRALGAEDQAAALERAAAILSEWRIPEDGAAWAPPEVHALLEPLDQVFYRKPDLYGLMQDYVKEHREAFAPDVPDGV